MASRLETILKEKKFDIIIFEGLYTSPYLELIKKCSDAKMILRAHNIESNISDNCKGSNVLSWVLIYKPTNV